MLARLGNVIYWLGCILAVLFCVVMFAIADFNLPNANVWLGVLIIAGYAFGIWLVGLAIRYILGGGKTQQ